MGANFKADDYVIIQDDCKYPCLNYHGYTGVVQIKGLNSDLLLIKFTDLSHSLLTLKCPGVPKSLTVHKRCLKLYEPNKTP